MRKLLIQYSYQRYNTKIGWLDNVVLELHSVLSNTKILRPNTKTQQQSNELEYKYGCVRTI